MEESNIMFKDLGLSEAMLKALEKKGCRDGDTVAIYDFEFAYVK